MLPVIIRELDEARVELAEFTLRKASLDEVFLALTGDNRETGADGENGNGKTRELEGSPR